MLSSLFRWLRGDGRVVRKGECLGCGTCCERFGGHLRASRADLERWRQAGRDDLLCRVNRLGWIWVDPQTKKMLPRCPFLERSGPQTQICAIHSIKPDICRSYPTLAHANRCLKGVFLSWTTVIFDLTFETWPLLA